MAPHREVSDVSSEGHSSEVNDVLVFSGKDETLFVIFRELYFQHPTTNHALFSNSEK
jgi:hypothetical protein